MALSRHFIRILALVGIFALAACETTPSQEQSKTTSDAEEQTQTSAFEEGEDQADEPGDMDQEPVQQEGALEGESVAVFVADTSEQDDWHPIELESGHLYINPEPIVVREDLTGVQAGKSEEGEGLLALSLNTEGQQRVAQATTEHPNKRLALIVGHTLLAAPGYSTPVDDEHLIFAVGTEDNAVAVARAIAGVSDDDSAEQPVTVD